MPPLPPVVPSALRLAAAIALLCGVASLAPRPAAAQGAPGPVARPAGTAARPLLGV